MLDMYGGMSSRDAVKVGELVELDTLAEAALSAYRDQQAADAELLTADWLKSDGWISQAATPKWFYKEVSQTALDLNMHQTPDGYWFSVDTIDDIVDIRLITTVGELRRLVEAIVVSP